MEVKKIRSLISSFAALSDASPSKSHNVPSNSLKSRENQMSDTPPTVELESPIGSPPLPSTEVGGTSSTSPNPSAIGASSGVPEKGDRR